ncbi:MFS transporter [Humitalea sp. 24SJ18S-53]|uniref:MFS transporter n=1 Tax=Humitalea sp. 24SJ18S-53 TaxID=3422307 RepID=UPI003D66BCCF
MTETTRPPNTFRHYVAANTLMIAGQEVIVVAVGWMVYARTGSAFALGMIGLAGFLPVLSLSLVTGLVADRSDRRGIMVGCGAALTAGAVALCVIAQASAVWPIFLAVVLIASAKAFRNPAAKALLPSLVPPGGLSRALAMTTSASQVARLSAPVAGGLLYAVDPLLPFVTAALLFCAATGFSIAIGARPAAARQPRASLANLVEGYRFIWSQPVLLGALSLDLVAVLLGGATALLPIFVDEVFRAGPWALGLLRAAPAVGALGMATVLSWRPLGARVGRSLFVSVGVFGVAMTGFGLASNLWLALGLLMVAGAADTVSQIIRNALMQLRTPDHMRGRVSAAQSVMVGASNELGEFESGLMAAAFGAVPAVVIGGVGAVAAAFAWARMFPALRDADRLEAPRR